MDFGETAIRSVNWRRFQISTGEATQFGNVLVRLIRSHDAVESKEVWRYIENFVFSQDLIYSAAEPTIDVMLAVLVEERPMHVKALVLDLLFLLLHGASEEDPDLSRRCRERALRGTWLLVRQVVVGPEWVREPVLEILDLVDPGQADALRVWLAS
jgi:hypothetical protein